MLQIKIKLGEVELEYSQPLEINGNVKLISTDMYDDKITKSERLVNIIKEMVEQVIKLNAEKNK